MKKTYLILLISCFLLPSVQAQNCGVTSTYWQQQLEQAKSRITPQANSSSRSINFIPLTLYFVRNTDGSYGNNTSITPFYESMLAVNQILLSQNIQFYVDGNINYIDNTAFLKPVRGSQAHTDLITNNRNPNTANVWINDGWQNDVSSGYGGPDGVELTDLTVATVPHEFGHFLSLAHTFDTSNGAELVSRSNGNCATAGDGICDTQADPKDYTPGQFLGDPFTHAHCSMTSNTTDINGDAFTPPFNNYMSYYGGFCGFEFTPQQFQKMVDGYNLYHTNYGNITSGGTCGAPTNLTASSQNGVSQISWTNASGAVATMIEFSDDNGTSWTQMEGLGSGISNTVASHLTAGTSYQLRARHLNSNTYSSTISFTPSISAPALPIPHIRDTSALTAIGSFKVVGTAISHTSNLNENYSLFQVSTPTQLVIGGNYQMEIKVKTAPSGSAGNTYFAVWIDENVDGDFDDPNELKFYPVDENMQWTVTAPLPISSSASPGFSRIRVRCFEQSAVYHPTKTFAYSEVEDYLIELINEVAPTNLSANYNTATQQVDLAWNSTSTSYNYTIERSIDGVNYTAIHTTSSGSTLSFSDSTVLAHKQYSYKVRNENGSTYSNIASAFTQAVTTPYCTPQSTSPCQNGYDISKFEIPSISFVNDSENNCGVTSAGYSDYFNTTPIALSAGTAYNFNVENSGYGGLDHFVLYVDQNQNGQFEASEALFSHAGGGVISTGSFTVPVDAVNGTTRLRLRGFFNPISDACASASFGESEDYQVVISGGKESAVILPNISDISPVSMQLNWKLANGNNATAIAIEKSTDGTNFTPFTTASPTDSTYVASGLTQNTWYWFKFIVNGTQNSDATVVWAKTSTPLSTENTPEKYAFQMIPNPANHQVTLLGNGEVYIQNLSGQLVYQHLLENTNQVNISTWPNGVYLVILRNNHSQVIQKLVVAH